MKIPLFDFQKDALNALREEILTARPFASHERPRAIAFSAPTGSGKTIMMAALFEAILDEPDDELDWPVDWQPQPDAAILWVSDMPELNEQTRMKIETKSDRIFRVNQLVTIGSTFDEPRFAGGRVYFINTQKLAVNQPLTNSGENRTHLIWETLTNTAKAMPHKFYVIIDEAHRGMITGRGEREARTIMQRFLLGYPDVGLVKMPLVIGISATPKRFMDLLEHAPHTVHKVSVPPEDVRESGLLKDRILIHHPESTTRAEMTLLKEAALRWTQMGTAWEAYSREEAEPAVKPVLVVQVENATERQLSKTNLVDAVAAVESAIGRRLTEGEVAHAMHDTGDLDIAGHRIRKVDASRIDADKNIGVVFFKTSLSTGWDCPRAEVMMSFRKAEDHTYIAQLLGRMVRTPLARRILKDAALNDVHLFLPYFDQEAVENVVKSLRNVDYVPPSETGSSRDLVVLTRRAGCEQVFESLSKLVTYRVNAVRAQTSLRRYMGISRNLTIDELDDEAWDNAKEQTIRWMDEQLAEMKRRSEFDAAATNITTVSLRTITLEGGSEKAEPGAKYVIDSSEIDVDRLFEDAGRALGNGLHMEYWRAHSERNAGEVKIETVVRTRNSTAMVALESNAEKAFDTLYDANKKTIYSLKEQRVSAYEKLRLATAKPVEVPWRLPASIDFRRLSSDPLWERHLFVEDDGQFRAKLGTWETDILQEELACRTVVGWIRNIDRKQWSLQIPYETGGEVRPTFPDLVIVRSDGKDFTVDILEPHDPSRGDNFEKARGFARFAERHGALFGRIQMIRKRPSKATGSAYARLEINDSAHIRQLLLITSNPQLDDLFDRLAQ